MEVIRMLSQARDDGSLDEVGSNGDGEKGLE